MKSAYETFCAESTKIGESTRTFLKSRYERIDGWNAETRGVARKSLTDKPTL